MKYEFKKGNPDTFTQDTVTRYNEDGSVLSIPCDESNSDYQRYLRWLENPDAEEGGTL